PQAINHSLMRPYVTEIESFNYVPFAIEIILVEILLLLFIFYREKMDQINPLVCCIIFFSLTFLLIIGYTIPIMGAIVRYRSIYFIFLLIPVLCLTDWNSVRRTINIKPNNM